MKKNLSIVIGLAMAISMGTSCFAKDEVSSSGTTESTVSQDISDYSNFTLDNLLKLIETNNKEIQMIDQKILLYQRQFDRDHQNALSYADKDKSNYPAGQYASIKVLMDVVPRQDQQNIKDAENERKETLQNIKFSLEGQYLNAVSCQRQIAVINSQIENMDKQIEQTNAKIKQGQLTSDALENLEVQKSNFITSLNTPKAQLQQYELNIKQAINVDLNMDVTLQEIGREFAKFDDSNIQSRIDQAVNNCYDLQKITNNIETLKIQEAIYKKYSYNDATGEVSAGLNIQDAQNSIYTTQLGKRVELWNQYYTLKNSEDTVNTQQIKVDNAKMNYDIAQAKVNAGVLTQVELDSYALALESENVNLKNAVDNYMILSDQFEYALTKDLPATSSND
ncbi:TolC family protein [Clostridium sp.]|uniref:TolC family protein n=1 Tax=Clostridium sp. TaxID=1506 RepID=UPI0035A02E3D